MTRRLIRIFRPALALVVIAAGTVAGCGRTSEQTPLPAQPVVSVTVASVTAVDLSSKTEAGGIIQAGETARITSQVVAPIQDVLVRAGDRVSRGQRLVILDAREVTAHAERANAALAAASAAAQATASRVRSAEAGLALAAATHTRISALHDKRSATQQELDQAVATLRSAEAQVASARADSTSAEASREAARAELEAATVSRSYAVLTAPFDGRVAERLADPGSLASPGVPLLVLESDTARKLEVRLDETRAAGVTVGQPAEVRLDAAADAGWSPTTVTEIARVDPASHSVLITLAWPGAAPVRTGSFGRARFAGPARRTLTAPASSLVHRAGLTFVFAVDGDNVARLRPVVIGSSEGGVAEVLSGLADGEPVVVMPPPALADGQHVRAIPSPARTQEEQRP